MPTTKPDPAAERCPTMPRLTPAQAVALRMLAERPRDTTAFNTDDRIGGTTFCALEKHGLARKGADTDWNAAITDRGRAVLAELESYLRAALSPAAKEET